MLYNTHYSIKFPQLLLQLYYVIFILVRFKVHPNESIDETVKSENLCLLFDNLLKILWMTFVISQ